MNSKLAKRKFTFIFSKYYILIVIGLVLAIMAGGYFTIIKDVVDDIQEVGVVDLDERNVALNNRRMTLTRLEDLNSQYSDITNEQLLQLASVLPYESELPQLMIEIKNFVEENELNLVAINGGPLTLQGDGEGSTVKSKNISIKINGVNSYFKLKDFLDNLSKNLPLLELNSLSYAPGGTSYELNLTLYYQ